MKNMSLLCILSSLKLKNDYELRLNAKKELLRRYDEDIYDVLNIIVNIVSDTKDKPESVNDAKKLEETQIRYMENLFKMKGFSMEEYAKLVTAISALWGKQKFPMPIECVMEMYHSKDPFYVKKAKEYIVVDFGNYVHDIIHKKYSTYAVKYGEELFQCGCIGLLKAMTNYDVSVGAFTTYCQFFVQHEISEQINFNRNDTTVHFNNIQRKINNAINQLKDEGYDVTIKKISILTELKPDIIKRELDYIERTKFRYLDAEETDHMCEYEDTPEGIFAKQEKVSALTASINRLPKKYRDVVLMKMEERTNEQIAKALSIHVGQVKNYFQKGMLLMRKDPCLYSLFPEYISDAEAEMLKYTAQTIAPEKDIDGIMDETLMLLTGIDPASENSSEDEDDGLSALISALS